MNDMIDAEVSEALSRLRKIYPTESVEIWVRLNPGEPALFIAKVNEPGQLSGATYSIEMSSAHYAVEDVIRRAGPRSPEARKAAKIKALQAQLAELGVSACGDGEPAQSHEACGQHVTES